MHFTAKWVISCLNWKQFFIYRLTKLRTREFKIEFSIAYVDQTDVKERNEKKEEEDLHVFVTEPRIKKQPKTISDSWLFNDHHVQVPDTAQAWRNMQTIPAKWFYSQLPFAAYQVKSEIFFHRLNGWEIKKKFT